MPMVLPSTLIPVLVPVIKIPPLSAPSTSGNALLLAPLLSLIKLAGPITSAIMLGFNFVGSVLGLVSVVMPLKPLPMWLPALVDDRPMRLPMMKLGRNTAPALTWMPCPVLPLMTLFGPIKLPNGEPTMFTPEPPLATAKLPLTSVPIILPDAITPARF